MERRIKELESLISRAEIIKISNMSGSIKFGATVEIIDEETEILTKYQIVGEAEADLENNLLNIKSPLAKSLIGKEEGDSVEVSTPGGKKSYEIISIKYL